MAADSRYGRLGLEIDWKAPQDVSQNVRPGEHVIDVAGYFRGATITETLALAVEFLAQAEIEEPLPWVSATYPSLDGYYLTQDLSIDANWRNAALIDPGWIEFRARLKREGSHSQAKLLSELGYVSAVEDHSTTPSYSWAPPVGAQSVDAGNTGPVLVTRTTTDGDITVATDMTVGTIPTWSVAPSGYFAGACYIYAADVLRAGLDLPMDAADWVIGNGLVEVRPSAFQGTSDGGIQFRAYDGAAWGDWLNFQINHAGTNTIGKWHFVTIMGDTAGEVRLRIQRDAEEDTTPTTTLHELDFKLRRGMPFVECVYKFTGAAATHALEANETDTATRPGGTASYALLDTLDSVGNQILFGTPKAFTLSGLEIQIDVASQEMPFWIGAAINDAANGTGNGPADLAEQYVGQVAETVKAARR